MRKKWGGLSSPHFSRALLSIDVDSGQSPGGEEETTRSLRDLNPDHGKVLSTESHQ